MPPVSLPLNGGTQGNQSVPLNQGGQSACAGAHASIPHTATRLATLIIRIADSISLGGILKRIRRPGKNGWRFDAELLPGVAALHLTSSGLPARVGGLLIRRIAHARPVHIPEKTLPWRRPRRPGGAAGMRTCARC